MRPKAGFQAVTLLVQKPAVAMPNRAASRPSWHNGWSWGAKCFSSREQASEEAPIGGAASTALPLRAGQSARPGHVCHLLHAQAPRRAIFWRPAGAGAQAGWLLLPRLRNARPGEALDRRPPSGAGRLPPAPHDLALSSLSRHRQPNPCDAPAHVAATSGALARAAPERP